MNFQDKNIKEFCIQPISQPKPARAFVFAFNNNFAKYFGTALKSLIDNSKPDCFYDVIVFSSDISPRNKRLLLEMLPENFSLRFFDVSGYISDLLEGISLLTTYHWSVEMYYRIIIPLVMRDYERVLYTDADIIFNEDISGIFNISFDDKELSSMISELASSPSIEDAVELWKRAQIGLWEYVPVIIPGHYATVYASSSSLHDIDFTDGYHFRNAFLD